MTRLIDILKSLFYGSFIYELVSITIQLPFLLAGIAISLTLILSFVLFLYGLAYVGFWSLVHIGYVIIKLVGG